MVKRGGGRLYWLCRNRILPFGRRHPGTETSVETAFDVHMRCHSHTATYRLAMAQKSLNQPSDFPMRMSPAISCKLSTCICLITLPASPLSKSCLGHLFDVPLRS